MAKQTNRKSGLPSVRSGAASHESRLQLMLAAEHLVGQLGLGSVSARAVAEKAKFRNNCSVQYHFGSLDNLYEQLVRYRMALLEPYRQEMIQSSGIDLKSSITPEIALELICLPHLRLRDSAGDYPYASFLCQYLPMRFPAGTIWVMRRSVGSPPTITTIVECLRKTMPTMQREIFNRRLASSTLVFLNCLRSLSKSNGLLHSRALEASLIKDALYQAIGALTARHA